MSGKPQPRAVFLVGFMGAGKTSVGQALAKRLGWRFADLDDRVEKRERRLIAEIFRQSGEPAFRAAETSALRELLAELQSGEPAVVALGGGAPLRPENAALLESCGAPQVFLDAPFEVICERCQATVGSRPLFSDDSSARQLYDLRRPQYLRARLRVDTSERSIEQAAADIAHLLLNNEGRTA